MLHIHTQIVFKHMCETNQSFDGRDKCERTKRGQQQQQQKIPSISNDLQFFLPQTQCDNVRIY